MPTQVQVRGAVEATQSIRTLVSRELDVNVTDSRLSVHDGSSPGGVQHLTSFDSQNNEFTYASATGTNALTITLNVAPTSYVEGQKFTIIPASNNTSSVTMNVNGLGAKNLYKHNGSGSLVALSIDDVRANIPFEAVYDGTQFILHSSSGGGVYLETQVFTTSGTWTKPGGCKYVEVIVIGGGGGGGHGNNGDGSTGSTSSFGTHCSATGGQGGEDGATTVNPRLGGLGVDGDINFRGDTGETPNIFSSTSSNDVNGARGGGTHLAGQSRFTRSAVNAYDGNEYGGGGGGGVIDNGTAFNIGGGGCGGGTALKTILNASLASSETVTIGSGGSGGGTSTPAGGDGASGVVIVKAYG